MDIDNEMDREKKFDKGYYYTKTHEWIYVEELIGLVGITNFAQDSLGDIVFVELPELGDGVSQNDAVGTLESVKAASDVCAPVSGEISEVNEALVEGGDGSPGRINDSPMEEGWLFRIEMSDEKELANLMRLEEYEAFIQK